MRYLLLPIMTLALNVASTSLASADRGGHGNGHGRAHWSGGHHGSPKAKAVPELDGSALPAALTLLAGASVLLMNRRRTDDAAAR